MARQIRTSAKAVIIQNGRLLAIRISDGREDFHRIDLVFLCDFLGTDPNAELHIDTFQTGFDRLDISELNRLPLYPSKLRRQIMNFYEGKEYLKYLGNEETGDPECLE